MPWGRSGGQNIEHPHTLLILSSLLLIFFFFFFFFFLLQMHFSFIGKAQFRRATLFWDSSYYTNQHEKKKFFFCVYPQNTHCAKKGFAEESKNRIFCREFRLQDSEKLRESSWRNSLKLLKVNRTKSTVHVHVQKCSSSTWMYLRHFAL